MRMVVTLRNGVQISQRVTEYKVKHDGNVIHSLSWRLDDMRNADNNIQWVDTSEVVAVHTEYKG